MDSVQWNIPVSVGDHTPLTRSVATSICPDATNNVVQDIFLDVLSSTATKREAKTYLQRYNPQKVVERKHRIPKTSVGVNLGSLYLPIRSVDESPIFSHSPAQSAFSDASAGPLHVALVKLKSPQSVDAPTLDGVGHTLSQLSRLGLNCIVVMDYSSNGEEGTPPTSFKVNQQVDRIVAAIDRHGRPGARRLDNVVETISFSQESAASIQVRGATRVTNRKLLLAPVRRGIIPVIAPITFKPESQVLSRSSADEIILALTQDLAGLQSAPSHDEEPEKLAKEVASVQKAISLDRIIVLDPLGGIPSNDLAHGTHVFINLEQEYVGIRKGLLDPAPSDGEPKVLEASTTNLSGAFTATNPISRVWNTDFPPTSSASAETSAQVVVTSLESHARNLDLLRNVLGLLPPTSSGIITTPREAANSQSVGLTPSHAPGVGTRRRRNPLIHNLLTDKPVFSSSLPSRPLYSAQDESAATPTTFVKRGMPVTILPDPHLHPWKPPTNSSPSIKLSDPRVDMARLIHLIEDSFDRKLDIPRYFSRISERIAGVIICGNYEGGAILTWEAPFPGCSPQQMVPYLDKFAVLKRSQGAGGVADIVFKAMVGDCFPNGVCWRSRRGNPVNKWYFERSKGTWKMPNANWTMFWTTDAVEAGDDRGVFADYSKVCRDVTPSWADKKAIED